MKKTSNGPNLKEWTLGKVRNYVLQAIEAAAASQQVKSYDLILMQVW